MKKILRSVVVGTAVGTIGLAGCDNAAAPPTSPSKSAAPAATPANTTPVDMVRAQLADAVRDQDTYSRARRLASLLPTLGVESVPAVKQTLDDLRVDLKATDLELLVRFWATHQPQEAALWAKQKSPLNYRPVAIYSAVSAWAQADPQAALKGAWDWADTPGLESIIPIAIVRGWYAQGDPAELREFLRTMPPDILGQRALAAYVRVMIETQGSEAAKAWAESLPDTGDDKDYKLMVFRRVVDSLSQLDVKAAIAWCDLHCLGPYGSNMRSLISRNWALYDGPAAMAWLSTANRGNDRDLAVLLTFGLWSRTEREAAMAWMASQTKTGEVPEWLHPAIPAYAKLLSGDSPREAIKLAQQIDNAAEREQVLIGVVRVWRHLDEAAADQWLATANFSEQALEKVHAPIPDAPDPNG